jgi:hypothetical protein
MEKLIKDGFIKTSTFRKYWKPFVYKLDINKLLIGFLIVSAVLLMSYKYDRESKIAKVL